MKIMIGINESGMTTEDCYEIDTKECIYVSFPKYGIIYSDYPTLKNWKNCYHGTDVRFLPLEFKKFPSNSHKFMEEVYRQYPEFKL